MSIKCQLNVNQMPTKCQSNANEMSIKCRLNCLNNYDCYIIFLFFLRVIQVSQSQVGRSRSEARAGPSCMTRFPLHLCSGCGVVMWSAVCLSAPHSHEADGASPVWFKLCFNLPYPVLIRLRRTSECRLNPCPSVLF